jgi:hypothetical protein
MSRRFQRALAQAASRVIAPTATIAFLVASLDLPMPASGAKDTSRPFPCMYRRCGCMSADQCWGGCCCFTNRQKVAWSKEHGVAPPRFVAAAASREAAPATKPAACCDKRGCNASHGVAKKEIESSEPSNQTPATVTAASNGLIPAVSSRQCRGQAELWLTLGAVAPLPAKVEAPHHWPACDRLDAADPMLESIVLSLATPPPRAAF